MAAREPTARPTNAELELLRVLWQRGPSTVREVHEALPLADRVGYTTVLKLLQIMTEKGLVTRDVSARTHVYAAASPQAFKPIARAQILQGVVRPYPALADGLLYVRNENTLLCVDLRK